MTETRVGARDGSGFQPLLQFDVDARVFGSNWLYCDRISSYIAQMVSHNRPDSFVFSNLFSSALNELLETVFHARKAAGELRCRIMRDGPIDRIEIVSSCSEADRRFYMDAVEDARAPDASEAYLNALFSEGPLDRRIGLLELAVDYEAELSVEPVENDAIRLIVDLVLDGQTTRC